MSQETTYVPPPVLITWHGPVCYHAHLTSQTVWGEGTFIQYVVTCDDCGATTRWGYNTPPPALAPQPVGDDGKTLRPHAARAHAADPATPTPPGVAGTPPPRASRK